MKHTMKRGQRRSPRPRRERRSATRLRAEKGIPERVRRLTPGAPTSAEVAKMKRLRGEGASYSAIERALGWPDRHGGRVWYALNVPRAYGEREVPARRGRPARRR